MNEISRIPKRSESVIDRVQPVVKPNLKLRDLNDYEQNTKNYSSLLSPGYYQAKNSGDARKYDARPYPND